MRRNKYNARRTKVDGITFASKRESVRYRELKLLLRAGKIADLACQVSYPLIVNGVRVATYRSDFDYTERGANVVEDVKSRPTMTPVYRIKRKLMQALYGIEIREIA